MKLVNLEGYFSNSLIAGLKIMSSEIEITSVNKDGDVDGDGKIGSVEIIYDLSFIGGVEK